MNRIISAFTSLAVLTVIVIPAISFAETSEDFTECVIPIISNKSVSTEWSGLKKDGKLFLSLEDACTLTGSEIAEISQDDFVVHRNTVKLYGNINNRACLCVSEAGYGMFKWDGKQLNPLSISWMPDESLIQQFDLNIIENEKGVFVELFPFVYAFGADISDFSVENIADLDADLVAELSAAYNIKFDTFDNYYIVDTGIPFDEVLTEYMNSPDYRFQWKDWIEKSKAGSARLWDVIVDDYDGIFNYVYDSYESDMLYNEALIAILKCKPGNFKEEDTLLESLEKLFSIDTALEVEKEKFEIYNQFCSFAEFISSDDNLGEDFSELLDIYTDDKIASIASWADIILEYASYYNQIVKFDDLESNILYYGVLYDKNEEEYENKNISNLIDEKTEFLDIIKRFSGAKGGLAKFQKLYESYSGLYDSAEKLDNQIKDKRKTFGDLESEILKNVVSLVADFCLNKSASEAVPYLSAVDFVWNTLKVIPGAEVSDASKAEYIQRIALDRVSLDNSEKSYYSLILAMQSSYYAYSRMLTFEKRMAESENPDTNDEVLKHRIELDKAENKQNIKKYREICSKLSELITKAYCSNRLFYGNMNSDWEWTLAKELTGSLSKDIPDYSVDVENFSADAIVEQNFMWHIEPFIEAEDIINSDEDVHNFGDRKNYHYPSDEYSVIKQNSKYGIIRYDGTYLAEVKYDRGGFGSFEDELFVDSKIGTGNSYDDYETVYLNVGDNAVVIGDMCPGRGGMEHKYMYNKADDKIYYITFASDNACLLNSSDFSSKSYSAHEVFIVEQYDFDVAQLDSNHPWGETEKKAPKFGVSNKTNILVLCEYDKGCMNDDGGIVALEKDGKWGFFNKNGEQIIDFICDGMDNKKLFSDWYPYGHVYNQSKYPYLATEGYIPVKIDGKCGYYDDKGNEVIPVGTFEEVRPVHNGLAWVKFGGKWGVIQMTAAEPDTESETSIDISGLFETGIWQNLYVDELKKYMSSNKYNDESMFDLYDIDSDGIPELFISRGSSFIDTCDVYTVYNDKLVKENERGVNFNCTHSGNGIDELTLQVSQSTKLFRCGGFGVKTYKKLENGKFTSILEANENYNGGSYTYTINGKTATADEYRQSEMNYGVYANDFVDVGRKYTLNEQVINEIFK